MPSPEVVPRLIRQIYQVRPDLKLPEAAIHAVLFEVRRALPRDNPGRERLPFYWYTHGPYSEIVRSSIEDLERRGILREETKAGKTLLVLDARPAAVGCVCEDELWRIVREIDPLEAFINRIYRDHAPYEFMPRYRVDFIASLEGYIASRPEGTLDQGSFCGIDCLEDALYACEAVLETSRRSRRTRSALYACEAVLVEEPLFEGFNDEFTAYVSGAGKAFDIARTGESAAYPAIRATCAVARDVWCVFAGGVRILSRGHDDYYDGRLERWEQEYREAFSALAPKVRAYNRYIRESARRTPHGEPDERTTRILSSLIEGYLPGITVRNPGAFLAGERG